MTEIEVLLNRRYLAQEAGVSDKTREILAKEEFTEVISFDKETEIVSEGTIADALYFTLNGGFHASSRNNAKGVTRLLGTIEPAEFIGEVTLLEGTETLASATVKASPQSRVLRMPVEKYESFCKEHPAEALEFVKAIGKQLCKRLRHANATLL
ncbi:MAG: cyclic nucleotide-binding domain-containing protein [Verrucomicrobiales bacterium]|nr:cyclic nucleotide-binding domain-containing protein [Verrucomicrobiales bacterium]